MSDVEEAAQAMVEILNDSPEYPPHSRVSQMLLSPSLQPQPLYLNPG